MRRVTRYHATMSTDPQVATDQAATAIPAAAALPAWISTVPPWAWPLLVAAGFAGGGGIGQAIGLIDQRQVQDIVTEQIRTHEAREERLIQEHEAREAAARQQELSSMEQRLGVTIRSAILDERERGRTSP